MIEVAEYLALLAESDLILFFEVLHGFDLLRDLRVAGDALVHEIIRERVHLDNGPLLVEGGNTARQEGTSGYLALAYG